MAEVKLAYRLGYMTEEQRDAVIALLKKVNYDLLFKTALVMLLSLRREFMLQK
ncbi:MAG: hypothetical protein K2H41_07985 [Acetatifactor sp.]|nr:hypothetical protein [Acetatifactor sp.]